MIAIVHAQLSRLVHKRFIIVAAIGTALFGAVSAIAVFSSARTGGVASRRGTTLAALTGHGGLTEAFAVGASFTGFLVFVSFIALIAGEFSGGTFRALLLRQPGRMRVLAGELLGILLVAAGVLALAEAWTSLFSVVIAPSKDVGTANWFSLAGLVDGLRDYATVLAGVTGWAIFGTLLGVTFRSAPIALGIGFVWAGPFENIISRSWSTGYRVFPGQVLASLIEGGSVELGFARATVTALAYVGAAAVAAFAVIHRRDVTA
jgi:hypothetical protein